MATIIRTRKKKAKAPTCLLCGVPGLEPGYEVPTGRVFEHPPNGACMVRMFYVDGVCADDKYELDNGIVYDIDPAEVIEKPPVVIPDGEIVYPENGDEYADLDDSIRAIFKAYKLDFLGGTSGERGWSSIAAYARCPYLWANTVLKKAKKISIGIQVGSIVHAHLAIKYQKLIDPTYPLEPIALQAALAEARIRPEALAEAWRLFRAYEAYYADDVIEPLAVEHFVRDPRTGRTVRIDLILRVSKPTGLLVPGTHLMDHKTMGVMSAANLEWRNDGTILSQLDLWHGCSLGKRYGELRSAIVNVIGKQKDPKFERIVVPPIPRVLKDHRRMMPIWIARAELDRAQNFFPRNRASCNVYGLCDLYEECAGDATS